jgi:cell division protein YceG involved in septum cleavage
MRIAHIRAYIGGLAIILVLAIGIALGMGYRLLYRPIQLAQPQTVIIGKNASFGYVAARLQARKLIPSAFAIKIYARLTGMASELFESMQL